MTCSSQLYLMEIYIRYKTGNKFNFELHLASHLSSHPVPTLSALPHTASHSLGSPSHTLKLSLLSLPHPHTLSYLLKYTFYLSISRPEYIPTHYYQLICHVEGNFNLYLSQENK